MYLSFVLRMDVASQALELYARVSIVIPKKIGSASHMCETSSMNPRMETWIQRYHRQGLRYEIRNLGMRYSLGLFNGIRVYTSFRFLLIPLPKYWGNVYFDRRG